MAISFVQFTRSTLGPAVPTTPLEYPAGISAGDLVLAVRVVKPETALLTVPAGWTRVAGSETTGGTGTSGADTGPTRIAVDQKDTVDGTETGFINFAASNSPSSVSWLMLVYHSSIGAVWELAASVGDDATHAVDRNVTGTSFAVKADDHIAVFGAGDTDSTTTFGTPTVTIPGVTLTAILIRNRGTSSTGFDTAVYPWTTSVASGTEVTAAPQFDATGGPTQCGPMVFIRLREAVPGGKMKVWTGSAWVEKPVKVWSGSAWVEKPVKVWTGSAWVLS